MPDSETITEFLRRRKSERDSEPKVDWDDKRREWREDIKKLFITIRGWLSEAEKEGLVTFREGTVAIDEEYLGHYDAPSLSIDLGDQSVKLTPAFRLTVGAQGRVDMVCGANRAMIMRKRKDEWGIGIRKPGAFNIIDLDEESFTDLLKDITG